MSKKAVNFTSNDFKYVKIISLVVSNFYLNKFYCSIIYLSK